MSNHLTHLLYEISVTFILRRAPTNIYFEGIYFVCADLLLSRSQNMMSQPRPHATFHTYVYGALN